MLQFICGFGTRKANKITNLFLGYNKMQILTLNILQKNEWLNSIGFIKYRFQEGSDFFLAFDMTRIHPKNYYFGLKIAREALEDKLSTDE